MSTAAQGKSFRDLVEGHDEREEHWWDAKVGDSLIGTVVGVDVRSGQYGDRLVVLLEQDGVEYDDALRAVYCDSEVLRNEMVKLAPKKDEQIGIKRLADGVSAAGVKYKKFKVWADREQEAGIDWTRFGGALTPETDICMKVQSAQLNPLAAEQFEKDLKF